jgi:hypothetical protein
MLSKFTAVGGIVEGRQHALQKGPIVAFPGQQFVAPRPEKLAVRLEF